MRRAVCHEEFPPSQNVFMSTHISRLCYFEICLGTGASHSRALVRQSRVDVLKCGIPYGGDTFLVYKLYRKIVHLRAKSCTIHPRRISDVHQFPFEYLDWCKYEIYIGPPDKIYKSLIFRFKILVATCFCYRIIVFTLHTEVVSNVIQWQYVLPLKTHLNLYLVKHCFRTCLMEQILVQRSNCHLCTTLN